MRLLVIPALVASVGLHAQALPVSGPWQGTVDLPGVTLKLSVELSEANGAWSGRISIPQQQILERALEAVTVQAGAVSFRIAGIPGAPTFKGILSGDGQRLAGSLSQGGQGMDLVLIRPPRSTGQALAGFDAELDRIRADWKVPGLAVAIVQGGQVIYAQGSGFRDLERKTPVTRNTLMPIGSATKAFTTAVLASLVDEGKLEWDKPVRSWIPWFKLQDPVASERMTPLDLVTHRSGMPRHDALWYNAGLDRKSMVERLRFLEPSKDFRTDFQYNNTMFLTAGYLTEVITGQSWESTVKERIFQPLGMTRANFSVLETQKDGDFALPYRKGADGTVKAIPFRDLTTIGPAGSINASVSEMAAWVSLHLGKAGATGKPVLSPGSLEFLHTPRMVLGTGQTKPEVVPGGYAPGWFTDVYRGHLRIYHGGNIDGFAAMVMMVPDSDLGIVVLTNLDGTPVRDLLPCIILDRLLGHEAKDWSGEALKRAQLAQVQDQEAKAKKQRARRTGTQPSHPLAEYAGEYEHPGYGVMTLSLNGGRLELLFNGIRTPLEHWHYDVFNGLAATDPVFENEKLQFGTGLDGDIDSVSALLEASVKPILFQRRAETGMSDPAFLARLVGTYAVSADPKAIVQLSLRGGHLIIEAPGQPTFELVPQHGTRFTVKGLAEYAIQFNLGATGPAVSVDLIQPQGIYTAKRK